MNRYLNTYRYKSKIKWLIVMAGLLIGIFSLFYSNKLSQKISLQEAISINLFAKTQEFLTAPDRDTDLNFLVTEILNTNHTIPVILTDAERKPLYHKNIALPQNITGKAAEEYLQKYLERMAGRHPPIVIKIDQGLEQYIYYGTSKLSRQVRFYPLIQLLVIGFIAILAYLMFVTDKRSEQNRLWAGLAKETAHQLGTPISSLMAWTAHFREMPESYEDEIVCEIEKDVKHLETITDRFSNIGSLPNLEREEVLLLLEKTVAYLQKRLSSKVKIEIKSDEEKIWAKLNRPLFEWVIENICKNATDAMGGIGKIDIRLKNEDAKKRLRIDISDTGKGIPKSKLKMVFQPGYTTKKRGWGLGLTLVKRIVEHYHKGKIFVKHSDSNGTTFRILLPK